ncbi:MAG: hypothetical protein LUE06_07435 [Oscillospiraceae bacterium]|nr:hypothetical protein [Oscillospiraceae bacterium]
MQENNAEKIVPGISFSKKQGMIMIFRSTIQALSEPDYIRFLMNMEKGCLAVQACDKKTLDCFRVPAYDSKDWTFRIYSDMMQRMLWTRCGWEDEYTYRVSGVLHPEYSLVEFDLNAAERVAESQSAVDDG